MKLKSSGDDQEKETGGHAKCFFFLLTPTVFSFQYLLLCVLGLFTCVYTDGRRIGRGLIQSKLAVYKVFTGKNALKYLPFCDLNLCFVLFRSSGCVVVNQTRNRQLFCCCSDFPVLFFVYVFIVIFCCCLVCERRNFTRATAAGASHFSVISFFFDISSTKKK